MASLPKRCSNCAHYLHNRFEPRVSSDAGNARVMDIACKIGFFSGTDMRTTEEVLVVITLAESCPRYEEKEWL